MPVWLEVTKDTSKQDQSQTTYNPSDGSTQQQVIGTWIAISDYKAVAGVYPAQVTALEAEAASDGVNSIPVVGLLYAIGGQKGFMCIRRMPKRHSSNPYVFEVQVEFVRKFILQPKNAAKWNTTVSFGGEKFQQDTYKDKDDKAIQNSAGQYFNPTVKRTFYDEKIEVSFNGNAATSASVALLRGCVNSAACTFTINGETRTFPIRSLLLEEAVMSSSHTSDDGATRVWDIKLSLIARKDTFTTKILDQGFMQLAGTPPVPVKIKDKNKQDITTPMRLDSSGHVITDVTVASHFIEAKIEKEADLSPLFSGLT